MIFLESVLGGSLRPLKEKDSVGGGDVVVIGTSFHIAVRYCTELMVYKCSMIGLHLWMNLLVLNFCRSVLVLNPFCFLDSKSTSSNVCLDYPVMFSLVCIGSGEGGYISLVICVLNFVLLMMSLEEKYAFTMLGRIWVFVGCCFLSGCLYIFFTLLLQLMFGRAACESGSGLPFVSVDFLEGLDMI